MSIILKSPNDFAKDISHNAKLRRLNLNLSQQTLAKKSSVSYGTLKKFEQTGKISLESLLKIALVLDELDNFANLFTSNSQNLPSSIDSLLKTNVRKRGRK